MKGSLLHFLYLNFINFNVSLIQKTPVYVWLNICVLHTGQPNWHIKLTIMESFPNDYFWTFCKMGHVYTQSMSCRLLLTGPPLSSSPPILGLTGEGSCLWFMWISHHFEIIPLPPRSDHYWLTMSVKWSPCHRFPCTHSALNPHCVTCTRGHRPLFCPYRHAFYQSSDVTISYSAHWNSSRSTFYLSLSFLNKTQREVTDGMVRLKDEHRVRQQ